MAKNLTPYHNSKGKLNFEPKTVTVKVWRAALAKWKYLSENDSPFTSAQEFDCSFCKIYDKLECIGCPMIINQTDTCDDMGHPHHIWAWGGKTQEQAKDVYTLISKKYAKWKKRKDR